MTPSTGTTAATTAGVGLGIGPAARSAYQRLLALVRSAGPGEKLGGERELAQNLGVSRATVRQALSALEAEDVVRRVPGRGGGTFVGDQADQADRADRADRAGGTNRTDRTDRAAPKLERDLSHVVGVPALLAAQGMTAGTNVVRTALLPADPAVAAALELVPGQPVLDVVRIRLADGAPLSLERVRLPAFAFPGLLDRPLGGSLYALLEEHYGVRPGEFVERIEVVSADADAAAILAVTQGAALLSIVRTTRDSGGRVFEYSHDLFRADRTVITVRTPAAVAAARPGHDGSAGHDSSADASP